eukprot:463713_1
MEVAQDLNGFNLDINIQEIIDATWDVAKNEFISSKPAQEMYDWYYSFSDWYFNHKILLYVSIVFCIVVGVCIIVIAIWAMIRCHKAAKQCLIWFCLKSLYGILFIIFLILFGFLTGEYFVSMQIFLGFSDKFIYKVEPPPSFTWSNSSDIYADPLYEEFIMKSGAYMEEVIKEMKPALQTKKDLEKEYHEFMIEFEMISNQKIARYFYQRWYDYWMLGAMYEENLNHEIGIYVEEQIRWQERLSQATKHSVRP